MDGLEDTTLRAARKASKLEEPKSSQTILRRNLSYIIKIQPMSNLTTSVLTGHCTGARSFVRHEPTRRDTPQLPVPHRRRWRGRRTRLFSFLRGGQRRRRVVDEWRMTLARGRGSISNPSSNNSKKPNSGGGRDDDDDDERGERRTGIMLRRLPRPSSRRFCCWCQL